MTALNSRRSGSRFTTASLEQLFGSSRNSLGFLRTLFACLVVVDHAFPIGGYNGNLDPMWSWTNGQEDIGGLAVAGFFVISGFLVTMSFERTRNVVQYFWNRFLRIFPGFWVCLAVTVVVFAPIAYLHQYGTLNHYLTTSGGPVSYFWDNMFLVINQWNIDNLLQHVPYRHTGYPPAFDGSLWTLIYEFKCYIGIGLIGALGILRRRKVVVVGIAMVWWVAQLEDTLNPHRLQGIPLLGDISMARLAFFFSLGALMYLYRDRILISDTLAIIAAVVYLVGMRTALYEGIGQVAFAYLCMWLAIRLPLKGFDRAGDFSYGIYIYAFPIEQLCAVYGAQRWGLAAYVLISLAGTALFAVPSWFLVERRCLRLKRVQLLRFRTRPLARDTIGHEDTGVQLTEHPSRTR
jgi:peptidoglycan/LPS O-acetylase OafA/YrhL